MSEYERLKAAGLARGMGGGSPKRFTPEVWKLRRREQRRRGSMAQSRALTVLSYRHKAEYDKLYQEEKAAVAKARGPLPGDDPR